MDSWQSVGAGRVEVVDGERTVAVRHELHEVTTSDGLRLSLARRLPRARPPRPQPLLLLHGFAQNRRCWSLTRRSLAAALVERGFEVFVAELRGHGRSGAAGSHVAASFEDLCERDLPALLAAISELRGDHPLFLVGHSMGGVLALCTPPAWRERLAGVAAIAAPARLRPQGPLGQRGARLLSFALGGLGAGAGLPLPLPMQRAGARMASLLPLIDDPRRMPPWANWYPGSVERDLLLELLHQGYETESLSFFRQLLRWTAEGGPVGPAAPELEARVAGFAAPLLLLAGDEDAMIPAETVQPWLSAVASVDQRYFVCGEPGGPHFGHLDLLVGREAPRHVWARLIAWLEERADPQPG